MFNIGIRNKIFEILQQYEPVRKQTFRQLLFWEILLLLIAVLSLYGVLKYICSDTYSVQVELFATILLILIFPLSLGTFIWLPFRYNKKFKLFLKQKCIQNVIRLLPDIRIGQHGFKDSELKYSQLFGPYTEAIYDDIFDGEHNSLSYKFAETKLTSVKNNLKTFSFRGIIAGFEVSRIHKGQTVITLKNDDETRNISISGTLYLLALCIMATILDFTEHTELSRVIGWGVITLLILLSSISIFMKPVKLEDIDFMKRHIITSTNQIDARILLTPVFIEKYKNIENQFRAGIKCTFDQNMVMIAISTRQNLFELGNLFHPLNNPQSPIPFFDEINAVLEIIDYISNLRKKTAVK